MRIRLQLTLIAALLLPVAGPALADADPNDAIKYRKEIMKIVGGHTGGFFAILQGKVPHQDALAYHAQALADVSTRALAAFEQNTAGQGSEQTTAKDNVWSEWDDFAAKMKDLETASAALAEAAASGDMAAIGPAAGPLGGACKACHDDFRTK